MKKIRTIDRGPPDGPAEIHAPGRLSENMSLLPNGNLLCRNVPIARIGYLAYGPDEVPVEVGAGGLAYVERSERDLFDPVTMGSFVGAAVTDDHPEDDVTPENYTKLSRGFAINVRRGTGEDSDVLLADLVITEAGLIRAIRAGKREVSAGYDADYDDDGGGKGRQYNILGNHIALVERGRCGPRCAIGDSIYQPQQRKKAMPTTRVQIRGHRRATLDSDALVAARQRVRDAEAELEAEEAKTKDGEGNDPDQETEQSANVVHLHVHQADTPLGSAVEAKGGKAKDAEGDPDPDPMEARMSGCETAIAAMADQVKQILAAVRGKSTDAEPDDEEDEDKKAKAKDAEGDPDEEEDDDGTQDKKSKDAETEEDDKPKKTDDEEEEEDKGKKAKTGDSAALATSYSALVSKAEILVPGFKVPTFDAAAGRKKTVDRMCATRRKALDQYAATAHGGALLAGLNGGSADLLDVDCQGVAQLFNTAAAAQAVINTASAASGGGKTGKTLDSADTSTAPRTLTAAEINKANAEFWEPQLAK